MPRRQDDVLWRLLDGSPLEWLWFAGGVGCLGLVLWLFVRLAAWMRDDEDPEAAEQMMLSEIGDLHRDGDLSETEYRSIKGRLLERLEQGADSAESEDPREAT